VVYFCTTPFLKKGLKVMDEDLNFGEKKFPKKLCILICSDNDFSDHFSNFKVKNVFFLKNNNLMPRF